MLSNTDQNNTDRHFEFILERNLIMINAHKAHQTAMTKNEISFANQLATISKAIENKTKQGHFLLIKNIHDFGLKDGGQADIIAQILKETYFYQASVESLASSEENPQSVLVIKW